MGNTPLWAVTLTWSGSTGTHALSWPPVPPRPPASTHPLLTCPQRPFLAFWGTGPKSTAPTSAGDLETQRQCAGLSEQRCPLSHKTHFNADTRLWIRGLQLPQRREELPFGGDIGSPHVSDTFPTVGRWWGRAPEGGVALTHCVHQGHPIPTAWCWPGTSESQRRTQSDQRA